MIGDFPIANLVPMNVLHLKMPAGWLRADQEPSIDGLGGDTLMSAADAATNDNRIAFRNHFDDLHFPIGKCSKNILQIVG